MIDGDFNGDGHLDLAVADLDTGDISVLLGNGDGTFRKQAPLVAGEGVDALVSGDFNGDGVLDIAAANGSSNSISVFLGNGDGTFQAQVQSIHGGKQPEFTGGGRLQR